MTVAPIDFQYIGRLILRDFDMNWDERNLSDAVLLNYREQETPCSYRIPHFTLWYLFKTHSDIPPRSIILIIPYIPLNW
jgi:hypothetical protein